MAILSAFQIASLAKEAGFPTSAIPVAVAIAFAESGGRTDIVSKPNHDGSRDMGLWQINNKAHADLLSRYSWSNPHDNAKMAYIIYHARGNTFKDWTTFNSGSYRLYMNKGTAGAGNPETVPGSGVVPSNTGFDQAAFLSTATKAPDGGLGWFTRIVLFFIGIGVLFMVMKSMLMRNDTVASVAKVAKVAAKVAK
jgi:hypothetical protein